MTQLEIDLRISTIQAELRKIADVVGGRMGKVLNHAASVLNLAKR